MHSRNEEVGSEDKEEEEIKKKDRTLEGAAPKRPLKAGDQGRAQQLDTGENKKTRDAERLDSTRQVSLDS